MGRVRVLTKQALTWVKFSQHYVKMSMLALNYLVCTAQCSTRIESSIPILI